MISSYDIFITKNSFHKSNAKESLATLSERLKLTPKTLVDILITKGEFCIAKNKTIEQADKISAYLQTLNVESFVKESFLFIHAEQSENIKTDPQKNNFTHINESTSKNKVYLSGLKEKIISNNLVWIISLFPLIYIILFLFSLNNVVVSFIFSVCIFIFITLDSFFLFRDGHDTYGWQIFIAPWYLYNRSKVLGHKNTYFIVNAVLVIILLICFVIFPAEGLFPTPSEDIIKEAAIVTEGPRYYGSLKQKLYHEGRIVITKFKITNMYTKFIHNEKLFVYDVEYSFTEKSEIRNIEVPISIEETVFITKRGGKWYFLNGD